MFIKQIIIQGFKSYKDQIVVEPFSPKTNVIVGRNGSGKSNFFAAIRFVLSDAYNQMGREERQALLHEGSGSAVMSAYVEIIFDNSDDRFPTGKDEVILRRTIGLKKDEYSLDRKNVTKNDVVNLLESAGFSRSNPYYIVPQGRVTALTNMKDSERLNLLKEVAGTKVYEARRVESLKIMNETDNKRAKIDESLEYIKERLAELEEEKEELRGYQEKDRDRRCLEYAYYNREQMTLAAKLDEIDELRQGGIEGTDDVRDVFQKGEEKLLNLSIEIKHLNNLVERLKREKLELDQDRKETARSQAGLELNVKTLLDSRSTTEHARSRHLQTIEAVRQSITEKESTLLEIVPIFNHTKTDEFEIKNQLDIAEARRMFLFTKKGRSQQFKSKAERDSWLKNEILELKKVLTEQENNRLNAQEDIKGVQSQIETLEDEISQLRKRFEGWNSSRQELQDEVMSARDKLSKLREERKDLRREEENFGQKIAEAQQERERAEKDLSHTMDGATSRGLATIMRLKREQNISDAYGTLADLIEVPEAYRLAAEQTAGNSLFHYIVEDEKTASYFMEQLQKNYGGRVTFMPLAQLTPRPTKLPNASDAIPLLKKINYDKKFERAMVQVFGKTIVCPSLIVASQYARSHGCNSITPDGDTANKKGAMTGGYIDPRRSRLGAVRLACLKREKHEELKLQAETLWTKLEQKDIEITAASGEEHRLQQKLNQFDDSLGPLKNELRAKTSLLLKHKEQLSDNEGRKEEIDRLIQEHTAAIKAYEAEPVSDLKESLLVEEEQELDRLNSNAQELQQRLNALNKRRRELQEQKELMEIALQNDRQKLDQLNSQEIDASIGGVSSGNLREAQKELERVRTVAKSIEKKLNECETQIDEADSKIKELQKEHASQLESQNKLAAKINRNKIKMDKAVAARALLKEQADICAKTIRDLGVLPDEAFEKYSNAESSTIAKRLKKVNEALKKYQHVNKKAFEQYNNFTTQRDGLIKRRKELDDSQSSIQELVEVLDQRKDEAIERTFKQVSKEFASIFERLVPAGRGRLVIQRKIDRRALDEEASDEEQLQQRQRDSVENYTGIGISVSFNSKQDEQQRIQQLSGGQKSLCALALVFAIQQCDPAPFYLFDEIDANLDSQYRTAVAQMLKDISAQQSSNVSATTSTGTSTNEVNDTSFTGSGSSPAPTSTANNTGGNSGMSGQFICTTFRSEILLVADKCYGVTFHNKTSGIGVVSREDALKFVEGEDSGPK
ncbi:Chromosome segregation protein sudA [Golovinomyces cichoracearum]|uniref:Structural maintenance of chromosomes protein n=1 Tax=Golovinomyces cichoracearum TaxID=62708 RepID=A0A420HIX7_9PEZI|nr:Chromosome segregation protein sudA [Golovinomyces cichoracearum]